MANTRTILLLLLTVVSIFSIDEVNSARLFKRRETKFNADDVKHGATIKRQAGDYLEVDVNNPKVKEMANFVLENRPLDETTKLVRVVDAKIKDHDGKHYLITLEMKAGHSLSTYMCRYTVYDQPRSNTRKIVGNSACF